MSSDRLTCRDPVHCQKIQQDDPVYHRFLVDNDRALRTRFIKVGKIRTQQQREEDARKVLQALPTLRMTDEDRMHAANHLAQYLQNPEFFESQPFQAEPPPEYVL